MLCTAVCKCRSSPPLQPVPSIPFSVRMFFNLYDYMSGCMRDIYVLYVCGMYMHCRNPIYIFAQLTTE